ncbi:MAG TPA: hypothetical protein VK670_05615 [Silvibacterium sp.]|nr:hypothetical protein [Silvibacterium sp.]
MPIVTVFVLWSMDSTAREANSGGLAAPSALVIENIDEQFRASAPGR